MEYSREHVLVHLDTQDTEAIMIVVCIADVAAVQLVNIVQEMSYTSKKSKSIEKKYYETTKNIAVICTGLEHVTAE